MSKVITCPCGTVVRAKDDDALVMEAQQHAREVHAMDLTREQVLAMAVPNNEGGLGHGESSAMRRVVPGVFGRSAR